MTWNPNSPCVYGMEWTPTRQEDLAVTGTGDQSLSMLVRPAATAATADFYTFASTLVPGADDVIDIYRNQDLLAVTPVTNTRLVSSDATFGNSLRNGGLYSSTYSATIEANPLRMIVESKTYSGLANAATFVPGPYQGDYIDGTLQTTWSNPTTLVHREFVGLPSVPSSRSATGGGASSASWGFHVNNLDSGVSGTRRVTGLTVTAFCRRYVNPLARNSEFDQPYRIRYGLRIGSSTYQGQFRIMPNVAQDISYTWVRNPATGLPWTATQLAAFADGGANGIVLYMSRPELGAVRNRTAGAVHRLSATVTHVQETRVGVATRAQSTQVVGWNKWEAKQLNGSAFSWANNQSYLLNWNRVQEEEVDRRPTLRPKGLGVRVLAGDELPGNRARLVKPDFANAIPRSVGELLPSGPAFVLVQTNEVTSQPHAVIGGQPVRGVVSSAPGFPASIRQLVRRGNLPAPYPNRIKFTVRSQSDVLPSANIEVVIVGRDGSAAVFEATERVVVTPDQLLSPRQWLTVEAPLVAKEWKTIDNLVGWYSIDFLSASVDSGWEILTVATGEEQPGVTPTPVVLTDNTQAEARLFGGSSAELFALNYTEATAGYSSVRAVAQMAYKPSTPTGFSASVYDPSLTPHGSPVVLLSWDAHSDATCDVYDEYEIQRLSPLVGWETIYRITTDEVTEVIDVEAPRNKTVSYRIRNKAAHNFTSDWSSVAEVNLSDNFCGYIFASNHVPGVSLSNKTMWFDDLVPRSYTPLEQFAYVEFESGDGAQVTKPLVDRLDQFSVSLVVAANGAVAPIPTAPIGGELGRRLFDPLLVLSGNKRDFATGALLRLPYVAVMDSDGNRWLANVSSDEASRLEPAGRYLLNVNVRELSRLCEPVVVDAVPATPTPVPIPPAGDV